MDWSGLLVDYCDVFISCLDSHSDGTHSLQSIHCWDSDAMLHFSKSDEETNSSTSWMTWEWTHLQQIFIFGWTILKMLKRNCDQRFHIRLKRCLMIKWPVPTLVFLHIPRFVKALSVFPHRSMSCDQQVIDTPVLQSKTSCCHLIDLQCPHVAESLLHSSTSLRCC